VSRPKKKRAKVYEISGLDYVRQLEASPLTHKAKRVMTTGMVAQAFNVSKKEAKNALNYAMRQKREDGELKFREGEHYIRLSKSETAALKAAIGAGSGSLTDSVSQLQAFGISPFSPRLNLLTKRGVLKVAARFLGSDEADDVLEELIETYLTVKEQFPTKLEQVAQQSFQAGADFAAAHHGAEIERLRQSVNYLVEEHQAQKAKTAAAASAHARELSHRKKEKRRELRTTQVLGEVVGALDPGRQLGDERGQGYLFQGLSRTQLENMLQAVLTGSGQAMLPVGGAA